METVIALPTTKKKLDALKSVLKALNIDFRTTSADQSAEISDPELLRRIERYESGRMQSVTHTLDGIKQTLRA